MARHIAVLGAGIVGVCCALALRRDGHAVTLIDPEEPGGEHAASFGNGAWISPASVIPMSRPGLWRDIPQYMMDANGPLTLRPAALPTLAPWLIRFLRAGATMQKVAATARALDGLLHDAPQRHRSLAASAGVPDLVLHNGLLYAYLTRATFDAEAAFWKLRRELGITWIELADAQLRAHAPALDSRYTFAVLIPNGAHCADPGAYVAALARCAISEGASFVRAQATGFALRAGALQAVQCGEREVACDAAVIATGIHSAPLALHCGDRVPLASERGYHIVLHDTQLPMPMPIMPADGKMANTPTRQGLRLAGQVELARTHDPPNWNRADILLAHARKAYPALRDLKNVGTITRWMGHRPSTPDGLPVIGPALACADVMYAFGHGHVGLAAAPATAELVADWFAGRTTTFEPQLYLAERFR